MGCEEEVEEGKSARRRRRHGKKKTTTRTKLQNKKTTAKQDFKDQYNDKLDVEPMVVCVDCGRKHHEICGLWHKGLGKNFVCNKCQNGKKRNDPYSAKKLPRTKISDFIEKRVKELLRNSDELCGVACPPKLQDISVRSVSMRSKSVSVCENMKQYYADADDPFPSEFAYRSKALFVFQKQENDEVCFFGLHVQEFGNEAPEPNRGRVYISYLDSVYFFQPKKLRTHVYKELLVAYLEYCKLIGFRYANIWACPPSPGDDYIFHCHPPEQKVGCFCVSCSLSSPTLPGCR